MNLPTSTRDAPPTMVTPLLPPLVTSVMSAAAASASRTRAVTAQFRDSSVQHFPSPSPSLSLLPPLQKSLLCRMVVASMLPPLVLSTLPLLLNAHQGHVASCPLVPLFPFASHLPAGCCIACCRVHLPRIIFCCAAASCVHPCPPPLCSCQLFFALCPPLDAPPPCNWLCLRCRHRQRRCPPPSSLLSYHIVPSPSLLT